eukprot:GHVT01034214.1.p1 GENE.GHVT01034214.1~~GHVT01034214.1.p1  ORF type:complete len:477 (-),score=36.49 GHVT01034214.1:685-2115(-)
MRYSFYVRVEARRDVFCGDGCADVELAAVAQYSSFSGGSEVRSLSVPVVCFRILGFVHRLLVTFWHSSAPSFLLLSSLVLLYRGLWVYSLAHTAISLDVALYDSYVLMVFLLSIILLGEIIRILQVVAVIVGFTGVCLMCVFRSENANDRMVATSALGVTLTLSSALLFSLYNVLNKLLLSPAKFPKTTDTMWAVGMTGVSCIILFPPLALILHATGVEPFEFPPATTEMILLLSFMCAAAVVFYLALALALKLCSPVMVAIGSLLVLPLAQVIDRFAFNYIMSAGQIVGMTLMFFACSCMAFLEFRDTRQAAGFEPENTGPEVDDTEDSGGTGPWSKSACSPSPIALRLDTKGSISNPRDLMDSSSGSCTDSDANSLPTKSPALASDLPVDQAAAAASNPGKACQLSPAAIRSSAAHVCKEKCCWGLCDFVDAIDRRIERWQRACTAMYWRSSFAKGFRFKGRQSFLQPASTSST